ncbi:flavodoxin [Sphingomonas ginsenosidivorax]|uniref:Flavodoxin n=1 Tax=Sphingomonas ginsenosidivorax TaxID=862135 RepID=A0A5C6UGW4_9SPHN|nr:flavodoxin [Sphingomonas ginsenosidivorax]TXC72003.1 flavodoxin [Sphingomonas ginsenosidivorax]
MTPTSDLSRRAVLTALTILPLVASTSACAQPGNSRSLANGKVLVAYFTRSGNTRVIAGTIARTLGATLFEIRPARAYPDDYEETVAQARQERDSGFEPALAETVTNVATYDTVFLGFPIWGETAPPVIRSFLRAHDLQGKTLRPFITHGGYGTGNSSAVLASHAPGARVEDPFVMEADQERRTLTQVNSWLGVKPS